MSIVLYGLAGTPFALGAFTKYASHRITAHERKYRIAKAQSQRRVEKILRVMARVQARGRELPRRMRTVIRQAEKDLAEFFLEFDETSGSIVDIE